MSIILRQIGMWTAISFLFSSLEAKLRRVENAYGLSSTNRRSMKFLPAAYYSMGKASLTEVVRSDFVLTATCKRGHEQSWKCYENLRGMCRYCAQQEEAAQRDMFRQLQRQVESDSKQAEHDAAIAELDDEIQRIEDRKAHQQAADGRTTELRQKRQELWAARKQMKTQSHSRAGPSPGESSSSPGPRTPDTPPSQAGSETEWQTTGRAGDRALHEKVASPARKDWESLKSQTQEHNEALDKLMSLIGLEDVKTKILYIKKRIDKLSAKGLETGQERLGLIMASNPGTEKETVARLYVDFLQSSGLLPGRKMISMNGHGLIWDGVNRVQKAIEVVLKKGGGAIYVDDADIFVDEYYPKVFSVLNFLLNQANVLLGRIVFILAGPPTGMQKLVQYKPALGQALPNQVTFADYTDQEMLEIISSFAHSSGKRAQNGMHGSHVKVFLHRLSRERGNEGFTNRVAIRDLWTEVLHRQAARISFERKQGFSVDESLLSKEDIIGPEPRYALSQCPAWQELHTGIGHQALKDAMQTFSHVVQDAFEGDLEGRPAKPIVLNRVFQGSTAVGMVEAGKRFGAILAALAFLTDAKVTVRSVPSLPGRTVADTVLSLKNLLRANKGRVLIISEAQRLCGPSTRTIDQQHQSAIIRALVDELRRSQVCDQCVLLLGADKKLYEQLSLNRDSRTLFHPSVRSRSRTSKPTALSRFSKPISRKLRLTRRRRPSGLLRRYSHEAGMILTLAAPRPCAN